MPTVRVRIAPSPTGYPHIGTIWQALINYAFAKKNNGVFIVRIEDTDQKRLVADAEDKLFAALKWFGLEPDESVIHGGSYGPYRQSERLDLYHQYARQLIKKGHAYYCTCSSERLAKLRQAQQKKGLPPRYDGKCRHSNFKLTDLTKGKYVIRLKVPQNQAIIVQDLLRGKIKFSSNTIDDQVLIKSDGFPTYHLAVVVDDHLMKISHMVRAEEWLPSAPKNWLIYDYLGWKKPVFIHTPTLRNPDKSKMSKRYGHTAVSWYQRRFLPQAILNYLCLLGWSHPREKEIFNLSEFIRYFDFKDMSVSGPVFDLNKLIYLNGVYIRQMPDHKLQAILKEKTKHLHIPDSWWPQIIPLIKERIKDFSGQTIDMWLKFLTSSIKPKPEDFKDKNLAKKQLGVIKDELAKSQWQVKDVQTTLLKLVDNRDDWSRGKFFAHLRLAIAGNRVSLPLIESMAIIGQKECLQRIKNSLSLLT